MIQILVDISRKNTKSNSTFRTRSVTFRKVDLGLEREDIPDLERKVQKLT